MCWTGMALNTTVLRVVNRNSNLAAEWAPGRLRGLLRHRVWCGRTCVQTGGCVLQLPVEVCHRGMQACNLVGLGICQPLLALKVLRDGTGGMSTAGMRKEVYNSMCALGHARWMHVGLSLRADSRGAQPLGTRGDKTEEGTHVALGGKREEGRCVRAGGKARGKHVGCA